MTPNLAPVAWQSRGLAPRLGNMGRPKVVVVPTVGEVVSDNFLMGDPLGPFGEYKRHGERIKGQLAEETFPPK